MRCWKLTIDGCVSFYNNLRVALAIAKTFKDNGAKNITMKWGEYHA